jgi:SAM-dependent methyltransferase
MIPREFMANYERNLAELQKDPRGFSIFRALAYEVGVHPEDFKDAECGFATYHISRFNPRSILDIGSYRYFVLGMLAHYQVTTVDIRSRKPISGNEVIITCDAKNLGLPDSFFDVVISLCALEHFGLGRYGDEFAVDADKKAFKEMIRVLKPGGRLIFTTTITRAQPSIAFNTHRIYDYEMIRRFCADLTCIEEKFYNRKIEDFCSLEEVTTKPGAFDVYYGCWGKKRDSASPNTRQ